MGAFGSCLGVGRPVKPGANPRLLGSNLVNVDASPFGPNPNSRQMIRRPISYMTNGSTPVNSGRGGPMPKLMRQSSAMSNGNLQQQKPPPYPHHLSPSSQAVPKLVDIDDNVPSQNSHSNCNKQVTTILDLETAFLEDIRMNPNEYCILLALYDFNGDRTNEDLVFCKGDHLETTKSYMKGDWWLARSKSTKKVGYVPSNFVRELRTIGENESWYFGKIGRAEAEVRLRSPENKDGAFIIRNSDTCGPNQFSLSVKHNNKVKHYKIVQYETGGFYINAKTVFSTIHDLVMHYSQTADGLCVNLREPCRRPVPATIGLSYDTSDNWEIDRKRLKIGNELGRGQFGHVYEGLFNNTTRVAIKQLRQGSMDPQDFLAEAQIMKKMQHKNLVQLYAVCTREEPVYIITELMSKGAMIDYLKTDEGQKLGLPDFIEMATQIASGMAYLEREKFVHRDLAARNILVGDHNVCKIADFGLARFIKESEYEARAGARFPIKWTAPEAANFSKFTIKSDVWSFGIVLFEIVTKGGTPYPDMTNQEVLTRVDKGYRMPQPPNCESKYYAIMVRCWNKDPVKRPTFESLEHELGDYFMNAEEQYREPSQFMIKNC
uniref:Tyrosine-protein kinase n=1 Tax=Aceria tosichella TaxID=561515 RepID=A0A6G1S3I1_9ACAR